MKLKKFKEINNINEKVDDESILNTEYGSNAFDDFQYDLEDIDDDERMEVIDIIENLTNIISKSKDKKTILKSISVYFKRINK